MTDIYLQLDYRAYKRLETQLRHWEQIETAHTSVDGFYHKALRLDLGDLTLEIQGPAVKRPLRDDDRGYNAGLAGHRYGDSRPPAELRGTTAVETGLPSPDPVTPGFLPELRPVRGTDVPGTEDDECPG